MPATPALIEPRLQPGNSPAMQRALDAIYNEFNGKHRLAVNSVDLGCNCLFWDIKGPRMVDVLREAAKLKTRLDVVRVDFVDPYWDRDRWRLTDYTWVAPMLQAAE